MEQVNVWYGLPKEFDEVIEAFTKLKNARDSVRKDISLDIEQRIDDRNSVKVSFESAHQGDLEGALRRYFSLAGLPGWIVDFSEGELGKKVLSEYGGTTRNKSFLESIKAYLSADSDIILGKKVVRM